MTDLLNILPAATWEHVHVNRAPKAAALPQVPEGGYGPSNTALSPLPEGVRLLDCAECPDLTSGAGAALDGFVRENANFRLFLEARGAAALTAAHTLDASHPAAVGHITVHALPGSSVTLLEILRGDVSDGVHASLTEVLAEAGSEVHLFQLLLPGTGVRSWSGLAIEAEDDAKVTLHRAALGGRLALAGSQAALRGLRSSYEARTIFFGDGDCVLDFSDTALHTGRDTRSEIHAAGALAGRCRKVLRGTIDFQKGAVHAVGHESEDVLLLSPGVVNRTAPLILCGEELVEGQHAASAGRLDEGILYYMAARGISEAQARHLMVRAKYAPVLDALPSEDLRCEVSQFIERRLGTDA